MIYIVKTLTEAEYGDLYERFWFIGTRIEDAEAMYNQIVAAKHWLDHKVIIGTWNEEEQKMAMIISQHNLK